MRAPHRILSYLKTSYKNKWLRRLLISRKHLDSLVLPSVTTGSPYSTIPLCRSLCPLAADALIP
jgi:hypothetical protein